jgi:hypothetical protein
MLCDYCGKAAELLGGEQIYPHIPRLLGARYWRCVPCGAHVGCHAGTAAPLGRMANKELRAARVAAHAAFDPFWQSGVMTRRAAYGWLATRLELPFAKTHIGYFDLDLCRRVVQICSFMGAPTSMGIAIRDVPRGTFENRDLTSEDETGP